MSAHGKAGSVGNYKAPAHSNSTVRSYSSDDGVGVGVKDGLSVHERMDSEAYNIGIDYDVNDRTGNAIERIKENPVEEGSVSHHGNSFDLC